MKAQPNYLFYATLLDAYEGYINSSRTYQTYWGFSENPKWSEEEFEQQQYQGLLDRINRVPFDSEPADRGTCFNEIVDCIITKSISDKMEMRSDKANNTIWAKYNDREFTFSYSQCIEVANRYKKSVPQVLTKGHLDTKYGVVELYGYIDELMPLQVVDIKTTSRYNSFKFRHNWQHRVYPFCLSQEGVDINEFVYDVYVLNKKNLVTSFAQEVYVFNPSRDLPGLINHVEGLIEFVEVNKHLITDKKIFNKHE